MPEVRDEEVDVRLTVLLPVYNEYGALADVIVDVRAALSDFDEPWQLLVVDDGSTDRSAAIAEQAGATVVHRIENAGYGAAVKFGMNLARGELIALLDADGSYPAAALPGMLQCANDYAQVVGARDRECGGMRWLRAPCKWFIKKLAEWISGKTIPDLNSGMRVFRRDRMLRYLWLLPDGFSCSTSMTLAFLCDNEPIRYFPIQYRRRRGQSKFRPLRDGAAYAITVLRMMTYFRPLRVFVPVALLLGGVALVKGSYDIWRHPTGLHDSDVILGVSAAIVFMIGLVADLIVAQRRHT